MIQVYYGNGKGKTTSAVGSAVRFAGCGNKVLFVQFLKNNNSGEFVVLKEIKGIDILFSQGQYNLYDNFKKERASEFSEAYSKLLFEDVRNAARDYQMIILDEILDTVEYGYVNEEKLVNLLTEMKSAVEIILTGHRISEQINNISDYVSEILEIKHPYKSGILPRKGIEF